MTSILCHIPHFAFRAQNCQVVLDLKILSYGSEIWGFGNLDILEKVQLKFYKYIFNLKTSTPSAMIYGELGILPLRIDIQCRMISFWARINEHVEENERKLSPHCNDDIDDEFHFLLVCKRFHESRTKYIKSYYYRHPNILKFEQFMNATNLRELKR